VTHGRHATEMLPESKDALDGPKQLATLAQIYALTGEHDHAFALLQRSLTTPAGITLAMLQLDPVWDRLRSDPRFAELLTLHTSKG
jgi:serine/threonine-protein kinase